MFFPCEISPGGKMSPPNREVLMSLIEQQKQILSILRENLKQDPPQLVAAATIAGRLNLKLPEVRRVLRTMEGQGVIETDPDQQFTLITREGLQRCRSQSAMA